MPRPPRRDNDSLTDLVSRLKAQIADLGARASFPVGKRWRLAEDPASGELVASVPSTGARVVLGTPNGSPDRQTLASITPYLGPGVMFDEEQGLIVPKISGDAGNTLGYGTDQGLLVAAPAAGPGTWMFRFTAEGAPGGTTVNYYDADVGEPWAATAWEWPGDPGARSIVPKPDTAPDWAHHPWSVYRSGGGSGQITYSNEHTAPGSTMAVKYPALTIGSSSVSAYAQTGWDFAPWGNSDLAQVTQLWGDWWELSFKLYVGAPLAQRVSILEQWPSMRLWLTPGGAGSCMLGYTALDPLDHINDKLPSRENDTFRDVPVGQWVRIVVRASRSGVSFVRLYLDSEDTTPADQVNMNLITLDDTQGDVPRWDLGPEIDPRWFTAGATYPLTHPAIWIDDAALSFQVPPDPLPPFPAPPPGHG